jgi:hypothetical protein
MDTKIFLRIKPSFITWKINVKLFLEEYEALLLKW